MEEIWIITGDNEVMMMMMMMMMTIINDDIDFGMFSKYKILVCSVNFRSTVQPVILVVCVTLSVGTIAIEVPSRPESEERRTGDRIGESQDNDTVGGCDRFFISTDNVVDVLE
ncbi:hypothetical protein M8J77_024474 [Diaphorina citri]|nr:hypothetical protein M8J77_024474 [Diaphorina citri]